MTEDNKIIDLYINKSINFNNMDSNDIIPQLVGFTFKDAKYLLSLLNEENIKISLIEVFQDGNYYCGKEFFYKTNFFSDEYYNLLNDFINHYDKVENKNLQFIFNIEDDDLNEIIKTNLRIKFSPKISDEEKRERKKRGWEFLE